MLADVRMGLNVLARMVVERNNEADLEEVEGLLGGIEERLMERRWI